MDNTTLKALEKNFEPVILQRGKAYYADDAVFDIQGTSNQIQAQVRGSGKTPYKVKLSLVPNFSDNSLKFNGSCTCPYGDNCKHMAAVLYAHFDRLQKQKSPTPPSPSEESAPHWLEALFAQTPRPKGMVYGMGRPAESNQGRTIYTIDTRQIDSFEPLDVDVSFQLLRKNNTFGAPRPVHLRNFPNYPGSIPAPYMTDHDWELLQSLGSAYDPCLTPLHGKVGFKGLEELIETKRFFTESNLEDPLRWGPKGILHFLWKKTQDQYRLTYEITGIETGNLDIVLLNLDPLCYLNLRNLCFGQCDAPVPRSLLKRLLDMGPLSPKQAREFSAYVAQNPEFGDFPLPPLTDIKVIKSDAAPAPILKLEGIPNDQFPTGIPVAIPTFMYGKKSISPRSYDKNTVDYYQGDTLYSHKRDKKLEAKMLKVLADYPLIPLSDFMDWPLTHSTAERKKIAAALLMTPASVPNVPLNEAAFMGPWVDFFKDGPKNLAAQGWTVETTKSFPLAQFDAHTDWYSEIEESGHDWFDLDMGVVVEGKRVNLLPILIGALREIPDLDALEREKDTLLFLKNGEGKLMGFPSERLVPILKLIGRLTHADLRSSNKIRLDQMDVIELLNHQEQDESQMIQVRSKNIAHLRAWAKKLKGLVDVPPIPTPKGLKATLRPYQQEGVNWMQYLAQNQLPGILADDMGLGKTVQTIAHILQEKETGRLDKPILIVGPTSLMPNWRMELERFAPSLKHLILHGTERHGKVKDIPHVDVVCTTYPLIARDHQELLNHTFHTIVLDEAQFIKNSKTQTNKALCSLKSDRRLCLTGTPLENHLGEVWSIFNFLSPGLLGTEEHFKRTFRTPIEKNGDRERQKLLNRRLRLFMMRRTKDEVLVDLPPKTEIIVRSEFDQKQRDLYEATRLIMHEKVQGELRRHGEKYNSIVILDALLKLRQICCDPALLKMDEAKNVDSAKLEQLMEMLPEMVEEGRKILLFSQFTSMLTRVEHRLEQAKIPYVKITGQTKDRETPIKNFQKGDVPIFLISLKSGGTGLNLTAADTVIHFDPWWNPAAENQATDRAHRIGQTKPIFVYKLIANKSVEEKILEMQTKKAGLAKALFEDATKGPVKLSPNDIADLFDAL